MRAFEGICPWLVRHQLDHHCLVRGDLDLSTPRCRRAGRETAGCEESRGAEAVPAIALIYEAKLNGHARLQLNMLGIECKIRQQDRDGFASTVRRFRAMVASRWLSRTAGKRDKQYRRHDTQRSSPPSPRPPLRRKSLNVQMLRFAITNVERPPR